MESNNVLCSCTLGATLLSSAACTKELLAPHSASDMCAAMSTSTLEPAHDSLFVPAGPGSTYAFTPDATEGHRRNTLVTVLPDTVLDRLSGGIQKPESSSVCPASGRRFQIPISDTEPF